MGSMMCYSVNEINYLLCSKYSTANAVFPYIPLFSEIRTRNNYILYLEEKAMCTLTRGERFKDARTVHNQHGSQSMNDVYEATGVSASMIKELEDDEKTRSVGYEKVAILAKHYGVSADFLLGLTKDPSIQPSAVDELGLSKESAQFFKTVKNGENKLVSAGSLPAINQFIDSSLFIFAFLGEYSTYAKGAGMHNAIFDSLLHEGNMDDESFEKFEEKLAHLTGLKDCPFELKEYVNSENAILSFRKSTANIPSVHSAFDEVGAFDMREFMEYRLKEAFSSALREIWKVNFKKGYDFTMPKDEVKED